MASTRTRSRVIGLSLLHIDRTTSDGLRRQLYDRLRDAIVRGELAAESRLPSTRAVAEALSISRNTVADVFEQLIAEGYAVARHGSGTYVASDAVGLHRREPAGKTSWERASTRGKLFAATNPAERTSQRTPLPFALGVPALDHFPFEVWARIAARLMRRPKPELVTYGDPAGYRPLREAIAASVRTTTGIRCSDDQVVIVGGSEQALDLACRLTLDPGDAVWIEEPSARSVQATLLSAGARLVPVAVDEEGISVAHGRALAADARMVHVTSAHQWPLGPTLSNERREELLAWADEADAWIVEEEYDGIFRYDGRHPVPLRALDRAERVTYIGTFSQTIYPALRIGYVIAPPALVDAFVAAKATADRQTGIFEQAILAEFIFDGHYGRHRTRMQAIYADRSRRLADLIETRCGLTVRIPEAGLHVVVPLAPDVDDRALVLRLREAGVVASALSTHYLKSPARKGLLLGFGVAGVQAMEAAVTILARLLEPATRRGRRRTTLPRAALDLPG